MMAIIAILVAIVLPAVTSATAASRRLKCADNVRQICLALSEYAVGNNGNLPPNTAVPKAQWWYDFDRVGCILARSSVDVRGPVATCPDDPEGQRSYAMNVWASCKMDAAILATKTGVQWKLKTPFDWKLILISEKWSSTGSASTAWLSSATIGGAGDTPGHRFGGGIGVTPMLNAGRFGLVKTELTYCRHRTRSGKANDPIGRVHIGYADGHVELKSNSDLVVASSGRSTFDSFCTPDDMNQEH